METSERIEMAKDDALPSLIKAITEHEVSGFDSVKEHGPLHSRLTSNTHQYPTSPFVSLIQFQLQMFRDKYFRYYT